MDNDNMAQMHLGQDSVHTCEW